MAWAVQAAGDGPGLARDGAQNGIRTRDLILTKDVLCQLSYLGPFRGEPLGVRPRTIAMLVGADDGTRTRNRRFTKPLLYQLSYVGTRA